MLLAKTLALAALAWGQSASLDAPAVAPAAKPAPPAAAPASPEAALRELPDAASPSGLLREAMRQVQAQIKLIEAKGRSLSMGLPFRRGRLRNPAQLPLEGLGFRSIRETRNAIYGSDDLIAGIMEVCAEMKADDPDMQPLAIGDISGPRGGRIARHKSHRNGRDADLVFFWTDEDGRPVRTEEFVRFNALGRARWRGRTILFDTARNWELVHDLLTNERFGDRVKYIFVYAPIKKLLLDYAERAEGDLYVLERAWELMQQPGRRAGRHDNHFHLRINCSPDELASGCRD